MTQPMTSKSLRVRIVRAVVATFVLEIAQQGGRVGTNVSEVNSLAALTKQKQPIENLEELRGGLMNTEDKTHCQMRNAVRITNCAYVQRIACPWSARLRKKVMMAQALCESRPEVGSSKNRSRVG